MTDLQLDIDHGLGRRDGIEDALRRAVLRGQLPAGTVLPSSRALAAELGVARATVVGAYEQLVAEGYLVARQGSKTVVAEVHVPLPVAGSTSEARAPLARDFLPGEPDHSAFPRAQWLTSVRRVLATSPDELFGYDDHRGSLALRTALATYLARARSVISDPARIVTFGGFPSALATLAEALRSMGVARIAMEDPYLPPFTRVVSNTGVEVVPVGVDADGLRVEDLDGEGAAICTPTHQFPMGVSLSPRRRAQLVAWARDSRAWIVEDDYDGEFRFDRHPVGALHGLDPERVVYAGTASKSLAPGLGIAWLVLPPALVEPVVAAKRRRRPAMSTIDQAALADFITTGRFDRHVRQMRVRYRRRRDAMLAILAPRFEVVGVSAGLHLTVLTAREQELIERAAARSIALLGLGHHVIGERSASGLVVGYSRPAGHEYAAALDRLRSLVE